MRKLPPLFSDVEVLQYQGKYGVQLELFSDSTLTEEELHHIMSIASWEENPSTTSAAYEGGRSILLNRKRARYAGGIGWRALQVSGIGYRPFEQLDKYGGARVREDLFYEPSAENFIERLKYNTYGYSYASGDEIKAKRSTYSPLGTYSHRELEEKVRKTRLISSNSFESIIVPRVEAYGRYVDQELSQEGEQFGFIVLSAPDVKRKRFYEELVHSVFGNKKDASIFFFRHSKQTMSLVPRGLREVHDAGYTHLQPHLSNFYLIDNKLILVDWETMISLGDNRSENALNKSLDLMIFVNQQTHALRDLFPSLEEKLIDEFADIYLELAAENYLKYKHEKVFKKDEIKGEPIRQMACWMAQFTNKK